MGYITVILFNILALTQPADSVSKTGKATYYASRFEGRKTSSGATYRADKYTAAHKTLPFGTEVVVTNLNNGKSVKVVVNDRGPYGRGMIIDLSKIAAKEIGLFGKGVVPCKITYEVPD
ncbi:MAG TPA: septal ring lytic transglycosylase RlpA family protein [Pelobium sp.]